MASPPALLFPYAQTMRSFSGDQLNSLMHYAGLRILACWEQYFAMSETWGEQDKKEFLEGLSWEVQVSATVISCAKMRFPGLTPPEFLQRLLLVNVEEDLGPLCILDGVLACLPDDCDIATVDAGPGAWWAPGASPQRLAIEEVIDCWNLWQRSDKPSTVIKNSEPRLPATLINLKRIQGLLSRTIGVISEELEASRREHSAATKWKRFLSSQFPEAADLAARTLDRPMSPLYASTEAPTQWLTVSQWVFDRVHTLVYNASQLPLTSDEKGIFIRYVRQEFIFAHMASCFMTLCLDEYIENRFTWAFSSALLYISVTEDMLFDGTLRGIFGPPETPRQPNWLKVFLQKDQPKPPIPRWEDIIEECTICRTYPERYWSYPKSKQAATSVPRQITHFDELIFTLEDEVRDRKQRVVEMKRIKEAWETAFS